MIDIYGPKMTKNILDAVVSIKGMPTRQKIVALNLPAAVKKDLLTQFEQFALTAWSGRPMKIDEEDIPKIRDDIRRNAKLSNERKADLIKELNSRGELSNAEDAF
jgi:hypothetical protein